MKQCKLQSDKMNIINLLTHIIDLMVRHGRGRQCISEHSNDRLNDMQVLAHSCDYLTKDNFGEGTHPYDPLNMFHTVKTFELRPVANRQ